MTAGLVTEGSLPPQKHGKVLFRLQRPPSIKTQNSRMPVKINQIIIPDPVGNPEKAELRFVKVIDYRENHRICIIISPLNRKTAKTVSIIDVTRFISRIRPAPIPLHRNNKAFPVHVNGTLRLFTVRPAGRKTKPPAPVLIAVHIRIAHILNFGKRPHSTVGKQRIGRPHLPLTDQRL